MENRSDFTVSMITVRLGAVKRTFDQHTQALGDAYGINWNSSDMIPIWRTVHMIGSLDNDMDARIRENVNEMNRLDHEQKATVMKLLWGI